MNPITAGAQFRMLSNKTKIRIQLAGLGCAVAGSRSSCDISTAAFGHFWPKVMLFTQKSPQTLAGALRSVGSWQLGYAVVLAVFREMFLPWITPVLTIADAMVFGTVPGMMVAWFGNVIGASICFVLSNLLFCRKSLCLPLQSAVQRWGSIGCVVLHVFVPKCRWYSRLSDGLWRIAMETMVFGYRCR